MNDTVLDALARGLGANASRRGLVRLLSIAIGSGYALATRKANARKPGLRRRDNLRAVVWRQGQHTSGIVLALIGISNESPREEGG